MYNYIIGKTVDKGDGVLTVENNGIGFEMVVSTKTLADFGIEKEVKVFTYLQVREDGITLFGFSKKEERALFFKLITVSGIGAKSAINILSSENIENLIFFIASSDVPALSKLKGIGKKTAERMIVELKDKMSLSGGKTDSNDMTMLVAPSSNDAVTGLLSLGFTRQEAEAGVQKAVAEGAKELQEIISIAIKSMIK